MLGTSSTAPKKRKKKKRSSDDNLANTYSNMVYTEKGIKTDENTKERSAKRKKQLEYVSRFYKVAQKN